MRIVRIVASLGLILAVLVSHRAEFRPGSANAATPQLKRISVSGSVTGGRNMTIKVTITAPAPGGLVVNLKSNRPSIVPVPPQLTFHTLATTQEISVRTKAINQAVDVTITASSGSVKLSDVVTVKPPQLSRLSIPGELQAGQQTKLSVYLNAPAPVGGMVVTLSSNNHSILTVQSSVRVPTNTNRADIRFSINGLGTVTITATMNGVTVQATTTVVARPTATPTRTATTSPTTTATIFIGTVQSSITASMEPTGQVTPSETPTVFIGTVETSVTATGQPTSSNTPMPPTATPTASGPTATPTNVPGIVLQNIIVDGLNTSLGILTSPGWTLTTRVTLQDPAPVAVTLAFRMEACGACYPTMNLSFPSTVTVQAGATQSDPFSVTYLGDEGNGIFYASYGANEIAKSFGFKYPWPYNAFQVEPGALTVGGTVHIKIQIDYPAGPGGATVSIVPVSGACGFSATDGAVQAGAFDGLVTVTGVTAGFCPVQYYVTGAGYTDHYIAGSIQVFPAP